MVEVGKIRDRTLVLNGGYISIFRGGKLVWKEKYMAYLLPDGNSYIYRRRVRITELSGKTLKYYQVKIEIGAGDPIFTHARSAGEDIRFCYYPEEEMLSYWIEKYDPDAEEAIIWVKVPEIPANSEIEIYMYYGNPEVASASDGEATFEFFDDFEKYEIDTQPSAYEKIKIGDWGSAGAGTWGVKEDDGNKVLNTDTPNNGDYGIIKIVDVSLENAVIEAKAKLVSHVDWDTIGLYARYKDTSHYIRAIGTQRDSFMEIRETDEGTYQRLSKSFSFGVWYSLKLVCYESNAKFYIDNDMVELSTAPVRIGEFGLWYGEANNYYDNIRIRKYTSPEPSVSIGGEE